MEHTAKLTPTPPGGWQITTPDGHSYVMPRTPYPIQAAEELLSRVGWASAGDFFMSDSTVISLPVRRRLVRWPGLVFDTSAYTGECCVIRAHRAAMFEVARRNQRTDLYGPAKR